MNGFTSESEARLEFARRVRHSLEQQFLADGADQAEIEAEGPALIATATFILDTCGYQPEQFDDGSWGLVFRK